MIELKEFINQNNKIKRIIDAAGGNPLDICYNLDKAILINDTLQMVLIESNIDLLVSNEKVAILVQHNDIFAVDVSDKKFLKFDTLREITFIN
jgi:hypothetical protein